MKKLYFVALGLMLNHLLVAQNITIADPVLKNILVHTACVDTNNDGTPDADVDTNNDNELDFTESTEVHNLYIDGPVTSLLGVDSNAFNNLDLLSIQHTMIATMTISGYYDLNELRINNNAQLGAIYFMYMDGDVLDLSNNNLQSMQFFYSNGFSSINCSHNQLTSINLNNFQNLSAFDCSNNNIQTLNLFAFPNLSALNCANNQITSIALNKWIPFSILDFSNNPNVSSICCTSVDVPLFQTKISDYGLTNVTFVNNCSYTTPPCQPNTICFDDPDFKFWLLSQTNTDANFDGEIQYTEAAAVTDLRIAGSTHSLTGLSYFTGLTRLVIDSIQAGDTYDLTALTNLTSLEILNNAMLDEVKIGNLSQLTTLKIYGNDQLAYLRSDGLTALTDIDCTSNGNLYQLSFPGAVNLITVNCSENNLGIISFPDASNLTSLNASKNRIQSITLGATTSLIDLDFSRNRMTSFNFGAFTNLQHLNLANNLFTSVDFTGLNSVQSIDCSYNNLPVLNAANLPQLTSLKCDSNDILSDLFLKNDNANADLISLSIRENYSLHHICADTNDASVVQNAITTAQLIDVVVDASCVCSGPCADDILIIPNANFKAKLIGSSTTNYVSRNFAGSYFKIDANSDGQIQRSEAANVGTIEVASSNISSLEGIAGFVNLWLLKCQQNSITSLDLSRMSQLQVLECHINQMVSLNISGLRKLQNIDCGVNNLTSLDVSNLEQLDRLHIAGNPQLTTLFMKNGAIEGQFYFVSTPSLQYICADEEQVDAIVAQALPSTTVNSYCSFTPGGTFYTVRGKSTFDSDANGCDASDIVFPDMKINIDNGGITNTLIPGFFGDYNYYLKAGAYTVNAVIENPTYFNVSPQSFSLDFPTDASPQERSFCITANGVHPDLEIVMIPLNEARPGFDARYKVVYKNKGNQIQSGTINMSFYDAFMDFVSSDIPATAQFSLLTWNFTQLQPFETRSFVVTFNLNTPQELEPLFAGLEIQFRTNIAGGANDETPDNNFVELNQLVVNSHDPNDKTCLEGTTITPEMVGKELHYMIRFENTGTASAVNVVVKDMIDTDKFDISSLVPLSGSHPFTTKISEGNKVEFIFENINLSFDDTNNDGYVVFKIKTKPTLVVGDSFSNSASIYFDYNFPIITNTETTTVALLANQDFVFEDYFKIYPNPVNDILNIDTKQIIEVPSINIYNTLGQIVLVIPNAQQTKSVDVSSLKTGNYFMKINSDKGSSSVKFMKL
jgi:hypothetical protein